MSSSTVSLLVGSALGLLLFWGWIPVGRAIRAKGLGPEEEVRAIGTANLLHFLFAAVMIWVLKSTLATPSGVSGFVLGTVVGLALLANHRK